MESWLEIRPVDYTAGVSRREAEGLAWRAIVRERLGEGVAISYNGNGAPVLDRGRDNAGSGGSDGGANGDDGAGAAEAAGPAGYIGVSHTRGWVAVVWSIEPCAVDIELKSRKISPDTAARMGIAPDIAAWCAWEAAYKYRSVAGCDADPSRLAFPPHPELVVAVIR